jgi:hypothetical protein
MRVDKRNLFAVLASCVALMLAGGLIATGAAGQGGGGGYDGGGYDYDGGYDQRFDDEATPRGGVDSGAGGDGDASGGAPMTGIALGVLLVLALVGGGLVLKQRRAEE